jgi:hypothetical protein
VSLSLWTRRRSLQPGCSGEQARGPAPGTLPEPSSSSGDQGVSMSGKSPRKTNAKKQGKTLKEKQTEKRIKRDQGGQSSNIPTTGH